ncbi:hypothetical protein EZS27_006957 [termite gut metagenome]|uniref:Uncharacterized protein n=1 Tax=termite gut metagenome TaxID=433724 RepID=A0A5J4SJF1_9ZZZZ
MVEIGQVEQVADIIIDELRANLTDEQFKKLGDSRSLIIDIFTTNHLLRLNGLCILRFNFPKVDTYLRERNNLSPLYNPNPLNGATLLNL